MPEPRCVCGHPKTDHFYAKTGNMPCFPSCGCSDFFAGRGEGEQR